MPALLGAADRSWLPETVQDARSVVLLVVDGLGWDAFGLHRDRLARLVGLEGGPITTVAPATTAAALTSITTGCAPSEHGLVGYRVRIDGNILNALSWKVDGGRSPDPGMVQRRAPFLDREVPVITKAVFRETGFTEAHLRGSRFLGGALCRSSSSTASVRTDPASASSTRITQVSTRSRTPTVFSMGSTRRSSGSSMSSSDASSTGFPATLRSSSPPITAKSISGRTHGAHSGHSPSSCRRARATGGSDTCTPAAAAHEELRPAAVLSTASAWVLSQEQLLDEHWLGPAPAAPIVRRLGDVVIAPFEPVAILDPALPTEANLVSAHGSLTSAEMLVPLVAGRGRA